MLGLLLFIFSFVHVEYVVLAVRSMYEVLYAHTPLYSLCTLYISDVITDPISM